MCRGSVAAAGAEEPVEGAAAEDEVGGGARSGGSGRKLQAEAGRCETRAKISPINRCWTEVSWKAGGRVNIPLRGSVQGGGGGARGGRTS